MSETMEIIRKPIKGYEGLYEVDNLARVFSVDRVVTVNDNGRIYNKPLKGKKIKQAMHSEGYKVVALTKGGKMKSFFVHRLVAEAFIPNPNNMPMINHIDEDKTNNLPENLEWCDNSYNMMYGKARAKRMRTLKKNHPNWYCADGERSSEVEMIDIRKDNSGLWCDDITFCPETCGLRECPRNKVNIRDKTVPHSFFAEGVVPDDCPKQKEKENR